MIYLDNAATTGQKPETVIRAVEKALRFYSANPGRSGHSISERTSAEIYKARQNAADYFGASGPEKVVFTSGCTHSINCVIKGVLKPGDHAVVSNLEHNAVIRPLEKISADYSTAEVCFTDDNVTVSNIRKLIKSNTRLIFVTAASNVLGKRLPLGQIGKLCRERGILFGVDAAQGAGLIPIDMQKDCIDYLCAAPHKGLYAPMGVGILIAEKPVENTLIEGGTGTSSVSPYQPEIMPERLEAGTLNVPGIIGINAGLSFVREKTSEKLLNHEMNLIQYAYDSLEKMPSAILYNPRPDVNLYTPVLAFNLKGKSSSRTAYILNEKGVAVRAGLHCAPSAHKIMGTLEQGAVRICPSAFNSKSDINKFLDIVKNI